MMQLRPSAEDIAAGKDAARQQWNTTPCGTGDHLADLEPETLAWFDRVREGRYLISDPWMKRSFDYASGRGKRVLEIGFGLGSDLLSWAEGGAEVHGIDITEEHLRLARRNFALHGRDATLQLADAAHIPYPDGHFDIVYSNGVLHHTRDIEACLAEAWRVLRPGGRLLVSVYRRHSAFHYATLLMAEGLIRGKLWRLGYDGLLATIEHGADGISIKPYVRLFTARELRGLLSRFASVDLHVAHFNVRQIPVMWRILPRRLEPLVEPALGWYLVASARK
jgi:2-polyprenyl-3-methyl-5-hydroxy-6-metoxy-1,4-benzoquinol methylase